MVSFNKLPHLVLAAHSRKWSSSISTDFRNRVSLLLREVEKILQQRFQRLTIKPSFYPAEGSLSTQNEDSITELIRESCFVIIDITDLDEELAFVAGAAAAQGIPGLIIGEKNRETIAESLWPIEKGRFRYAINSDLHKKNETICSGISAVLEHSPVPARFIESLWFPRNVSSIWVVCPQIEEPGEFAFRSSPDYTYLDNLGDTDSLLEIMVFLSRYYPSANIEKFSSRDMPIGLTKGNLVIVGGPGTPETISNRLATSMMEAIQSRISYTKDCESMIVRDDSDNMLKLQAKLASEYENENENERFNMIMDYGYFAHFQNPANSSSRVICINGIHTSGVLGSAKIFGDSLDALRNYQKVLELLGNMTDFECYFEVNVLNGDVLVPQIAPENTFVLFGTDADAEVLAKKNNIDTSKKHSTERYVRTKGRNEQTQKARQENRLKVVSVLARQIKESQGQVFEGIAGIFLLHALPDLLPFLDAFELLGLAPSRCLFYYKRYPYFQKEQTLKSLGDRGYQVAKLEELNNTLPGFLKRIKPSEKIFILEDGGYIGPFLSTLNYTPWDRIAGVVEQTERGVRMYEKIKNLRFPVAPVARSGIKNRQEPSHVGRSIISNVQKLLQGRNLAGQRCLVIGYGRIGKAVCDTAHSIGMNVSVYDSDHGALTEAAQASFNVDDNLRNLISDAQLIIGTTGHESLGQDHILSLQHGTVLVSGSSGQNEIGMEALDILSHDKTSCDIGTEYILEKGERKVLLLGDGYPINFVGGDSVPDEAIDPVLAALFISTIGMVVDPPIAKGIQLVWTNQVIARYELERLLFDLYFSR